MNEFSYLLAEGEIEEKPELDSQKFIVDDNIGEAIHIHYRNVRFEFYLDDFIRFAEECENAVGVLDDRNC